ncbi:hypothetical protein M431DRAFT_119026 [Trichoderma harzianum CBS 226.95]|uniref:Uncharacterized protein n=1 Tax=Trichoderma harzianum CBS 226.95 TaxID=983964 RepID=A0A2T4A8K3_TRIHA|nr:hypothetical protein M431DRAFT_119026 [Trichoderma harzianum CBS 226.95]PTB53323.1 hypothetical protein M431DRAFT_119026 [Trichoderma harzianum CBS 226.95]
MELPWRPRYVGEIYTFRRPRSETLNSHGDFLAEEVSRSFPFTFSGFFSNSAWTNPSKEERVNDNDDQFPPQQSERPRRTLANAHIPPPYDSGDDGDDEHDDDDDGNDENRFVDDIERYCIDFSDYVFNGVDDRIDPLVSDHVSPRLSATRQPSSSLSPVHDGQISLQDATFSAYFQILDARIQSGKRGTSCRHEQSLPVFRTEDENIESNKENRGPKDHNQGNELGDCVMVEGEEEDEEDEMTDSCLNVIDHLDYVMFPTAEVLEFARGGEMEVLEDVDDEEAACRRFLGEEQYDEDNKELGREELENRGRRWFRCGVFSKDQWSKVPHSANEKMQMLSWRNGAQTDLYSITVDTMWNALSRMTLVSQPITSAYRISCFPRENYVDYTQMESSPIVYTLCHHA